MKINGKLKYISIIALAAFLMNVIVPFFATYNITGNVTNVKEVSSVFGDKIFICTGDGFKLVKLADLQSGEEVPKSHSGYKCALCYVAAHSLKATGPSPISLLPEYNFEVSDITYIDSADFSFSKYLGSNIYSRAPPYWYFG
jgi:hypothetical protein